MARYVFALAVSFYVAGLIWASISGFFYAVVVGVFWVYLFERREMVV
jgi:hypothetical protein